MRLLIIGAGGHGASVADCALESGVYTDIAWIDDDKSEDVLGSPVVGRFNDLPGLRSQYEHAVVALGDNAQRVAAFNRLRAMGFQLPAVIHPNACVSRFSRIGEGTVVCAGAVINARAWIGEACIVNTAATIDHDCTLESGVHISPGAHLCGGVVVQTLSWIGAGAVIADHVTVREGATVGAGAAVVREVAAKTVVTGVPARLRNF